MPCEYESHDEYARRVSQELNDLTRWLCAALRKLEASAVPPYDMPNEPGLREWWAEHQRRDAARERERQEQARITALREQAFAKLTPEERAVL